MTPEQRRAVIADTGTDRVTLAQRLGYASETTLRQWEEGRQDLSQEAADWLTSYAKFRRKLDAENEAWLKKHPPPAREPRGRSLAEELLATLGEKFPKGATANQLFFYIQQQGRENLSRQALGSQMSIFARTGKVVSIGKTERKEIIWAVPKGRAAEKAGSLPHAEKEA